MTESMKLMRGTLDVLVLETLGSGRKHGYEVVAMIADLSDGALQVEDGALYQALHRMRAKGWVSSEWGHAETGKRARFYELTPDGRRRLDEERSRWLDYAEAVRKVLGPSG
jgi:transcriptional regulator